jgi:ribosomal protein S18 acetylase RimI-like enzyme
MNFVFEKLGRQFDRESFDCGVDSLNDFLKRYALQNLKKNLGVTIVAVGEEDRRKILGYYTVSMAQVSFKQLPIDLSGSIPRYPVPAMRIGRLAVDRRVKGMGLGEELLRDALFRALDLSLEVGTCVVLVDSIDAQAKRFYERYGFVSLLDMPLSLVLPMKTISEAWKTKG